VRIADRRPASTAADLLGRQDLTVDDVACLPDDLRYELIDGRLVLTSYALLSHQVLAMKTANAIEEHSPEDFVVNMEQAVLINGRNELRPDVVLVRARGGDRSPIPPDEVTLVVEVISKSSRFYDREHKLKWYAAAGIPAYWIIDPLTDRVTLTQFSLGADGSYELQLQTDQLITVDRPWEITLDLPAWTRRRDRIRSGK
jgi:Uma2 family endonuclease